MDRDKLHKSSHMSGDAFVSVSIVGKIYSQGFFYKKIIKMCRLAEDAVGYS